MRDCEKTIGSLIDCKEVKDKALKLYKKVNTFLISCVDSDGYPMTKAVVPGKYRDDLNDMYFCTNTSSRFAEVLSNNENVVKACVYFYRRGFLWKGCYLKGEMKIVNDAALKEKYWQNKFKNAYAEKSCADPDFCLLRFKASAGRYYSAFKPKDFTI